MKERINLYENSINAKYSNQAGYCSFLKQFIKFGLVGVTNTAISLGIYYTIVLIDPAIYIFGNALGFVVSVLNSYHWNNKYVFRKSEKKHLNTVLRTFLAYGSTLVLSTILLFVMVELLGIHQYLAPVFNLLITIPLNFFINKYWTFK